MDEAVADRLSRARASGLRRVLVTGADGLLGRAVTAALAAGGLGVTGLSLQWDHLTACDRTLTGDATVLADVASALADVDAVIHLAAIPHPDLAPAQVVFATNTTATFTVLSEAGVQGIKRAVIASSINAFGVPMNHHSVQPAYYPIDEDIPTQLDDWYSLSKRCDELTGEMAHSRWGIDVVAIRFPLVRPLAELRHDSVRLADSPDVSRLAREGWAYLGLADAVEVMVAGLTADVHGAHVVLAAADSVLLAEDTEVLLDRHAPGVERRREFVGRAGLINTARAHDLLGFVPRESVHAAVDGLVGAAR